MKSTFIALFLTIFSFCGLHAGYVPYFTHDKINVTEDGFMVNIDGKLHAIETITYAGNGLYVHVQEHHSHCTCCGWIIKDGQCTNQNCNGYGPRRD
jgi:hypothetical protein